jgi:hypothetical protein
MSKSLTLGICLEVQGEVENGVVQRGRDLWLVLRSASKSLSVYDETCNEWYAHLSRFAGAAAATTMNAANARRVGARRWLWVVCEARRWGDDRWWVTTRRYESLLIAQVGQEQT